ncbi:MAG: hypothetical protein MSA68_06445 [Helicobacter sp.]|nr:hypothetical protein [Helicobacter sp.]
MYFLTISLDVFKAFSKMLQAPFEITEKDFEKVLLESLLYESKINIQDSKIAVELGNNDE